MTSCVSEPDNAASEAEPVADSGAGLEVATLASDTLRASVAVRGALEPTNVMLLVVVLRTHLTAGRRYLRVDLSAAEILSDDVVAALVECHTRVSDLGGMLVFEKAGPRVMAAVRSESLFVLAAEG